ncbi:MAG: Mut7-C RNAse domain-containing protein, partial [Candidatus Bathyarchaeia archaeon]
FWECPGCGKVYWRGSHWRRIGKTLSQAKEILENKGI